MSDNHVPRILLVDDQADVRSAVSIMLRVKGFEVVGVGTAEAALREFEASNFDMAIVDIFLDGSNGADVISTLRARVPDLPVVAISGMTALGFMSAPDALSNLVCLQKPFRPNELFAAIESAMSQKTVATTSPRQP